MSVQLELRAHYREVRTRLWRPAAAIPAQEEPAKPAPAPVLVLVKASPAYIYEHPIGPIVPDAVCLTPDHFGRPGSVSYARRVVKEVSEKRGVAVRDMMIQRRNIDFVMARYEVYWRLREETRWSMPQIGRFVGRDHTTILNGLRVYAEHLKRQDNGEEAQGPR